MKKALLWIVAVVLVVAVVGLRVGRKGNETPARSIEQVHAEEGVPVDVATVRTGTITVFRKITGEVFGMQQSVLRASGDYKIADVLVEEGQRVRRGQTLVRYDTDISPDRLARIAQVRESYEKAKRHVERLEPLFEQGAVAESELDAARTDLAIAEADLRDARLQLEVVSPIDGVATLLACRKGNAVAAGDVLAQVAVLDSVRVEADVSGATVQELRSGAPAYLEGRGAGEPVGRLTRVALGADPDTRLFRVEATLGNNDRFLRPGLVVTLDVLMAKVGPVTVMPATAIVDDREVVPGTSHDVFAVVDGMARRTAVEIGRESEGLVEIRSGLSDGDRIVVFGANRLRDGVKVRLHKIDGELQRNEDMPTKHAVDEAGAQ